MREIPMPPDRRPIAEKAALDAARNDDGLRVLLVKAIWRDDDLPTAAAQTGGFVYEIADRIARAVEERERELRATVARAHAFAAEMRSYCSPHGVAADYANRLEDVLRAPESNAAARSRVPAETEDAPLAVFRCSPSEDWTGPQEAE